MGAFVGACIDCNNYIQEYIANYTIMYEKNITEGEAVKLLRKGKVEPRCERYFRRYAWQTNFIYFLPQII
jgi:hypothetical protein